MFNPVIYELIDAPTVNVKKYRWWLGCYAWLIMLVVVLGFTLFKHQLFGMILCYVFALSLYIVGYRLEKKLLCTFNSIGKLTITSTELLIEKNESTIHYSTSLIQKIEVKKDRTSHSTLLSFISRQTEYSYCVDIQLKTKQRIQLFVVIEPMFGYWQTHKNILVELEKLKALDVEWKRLVFIDEDLRI